MTKREFAEEVAAIVDGEVNEVDKANGIVLTGIMPNGDSNVKPNVYIDDFYGHKSVEETAREVQKMFDEAKFKKLPIDVNNMTDFDYARPYLRARLYNRKTKAEVFRSAEAYGFDDLIIVPYLEFEMDGNLAGIKVTDKLLEKWDASDKTIINIALDNTKKQTKFQMKTMRETLLEMRAPEFMLPPEDVPVYVLNNEEKSFGAIGVLFMKDAIKEKFPNGYAVIPSSVHEVLIVDKNNEMASSLDDMINSVNDECVQDHEVLGFKAYFFD